MKETRYTLTQQDIIKKREALQLIRYYMLNGFAYDGERTPDAERIIQDVMTFMIEQIAQMRKSQQETFDRMPWLANSCGRV